MKEIIRIELGFDIYPDTCELLRQDFKYFPVHEFSTLIISSVVLVKKSPAVAGLQY